jgi:phage terminase large subunit-like protein
MAYLATGSFFRPVSSESSGRGKSGFRPHCVLLDEIHEHPTNAMVEFLRAGTKGRRQPLIFMITNSGVDRASVCFEYHTYACKVAAGDLIDDSFFGYVCALEDGTREGYPEEDPFTDAADPELGYPRSWLKANPLLGVTFQPSYLEEQVRQAKGMPAKESIVRRLNFCQWVDAANPWIDGDLWRQCEVAAEEWVEPTGPSFLALDLSAKRDLCAAAKATDTPEGILAELRFWTPADSLHERERTDRVPYEAWVKAGHLIAVPGRSIDYGFVVKDLGEWLSNAQALAFDPWRVDDFLREMDAAGIDAHIWDGPEKPSGYGLRLVRHGQGFGGGGSDSTLWMPRSITDIETAVLNGTLKARKNPVLTWNSASAVLEQDATGNKKWEKRKSTGRIDGIVALSMAVGLALAFDTEPAEPSIRFI